MNGEKKSLLIFSLLGIASGVYWSFYVFYPSDPVMVKLGIALNGTWVVGYVVSIVWVCYGGVHWHHHGSHR